MRNSKVILDADRQGELMIVLQEKLKDVKQELRALDTPEEDLEEIMDELHLIGYISCRLESNTMDTNLLELVESWEAAYQCEIAEDLGIQSYIIAVIPTCAAEETTNRAQASLTKEQFNPKFVGEVPEEVTIMELIKSLVGGIK